MTPCSYIEVSPGVYEFHYALHQLRGFISNFKNTNRCDLLITKIDNNTNTITYTGYSGNGVDKVNYSFQRLPEFDGGPKFLDPELVINPPAPKEYEWDILWPMGKLN